jgi:hypothetical protein
MTVTPFPTVSRIAIESEADAAAIEGAISAVAGLVTAQGGTIALGGRDLLSMSVEGRAMLLGDMYAAGEVIFGWRDSLAGAVRNMSVERLRVLRGDERRECWRAELYREAEDGDGHILAGAAVAPDAAGIGRRIIEIANDPAAAAQRSPEALAAYLAES